jgi:hypothetical protein
MNSDASRNPTGLHGSVDVARRLSAGSKHLAAANSAGANQAAHDVGVDLNMLNDAIADTNVNRMGVPTVKAPLMSTLTSDRYTTSGTLVNPKVAELRPVKSR